MNVTFTELEQKVLGCLISNLYAEEGFSDVSPRDICIGTKIPMKTLRGVLGSLVVKKVIFIDDREFDGGESIIYLEEAFYFLHPRWKKAG